MQQLSFKNLLGNKSDIVLVISMIGILLVLFTPIPPRLLDFLLIANFSSGLLILFLTLYTDKPLGFSTFPSLLLIATLFRLALNIAATRLILSDGDAGEVIGAIGSYVVGGNYVIGLVVFLILIVVQYVVVTNGAQRVAEVAARFTLDSMPGKQMSIDADLNMGLIDESGAKNRRKEIEQEANFYGAMDGASKFVKGDAIAGIIIILIDIIGGLTVGVAQKGMPWSDALQTYTLLTVGDGIVTQIPALVISTATGIIVTRAATDAKFGVEITRQITRYPQTLTMLMIALFGFLLLPGIPAAPVFLLFLVAGILLYAAMKGSERVSEDNGEKSDSAVDSIDSLYHEIAVHPVEVHIGSALADYLGSGSSSVFMEKIKLFRKQLAFDLGFVLPHVRIVDGVDASANGYEIRLYGVRVAEGSIYSDKELAISAHLDSSVEGIRTKDPTYGLPAVWVDESNKEKARKLGYTIADGSTVMVTHVSEVLKNNVYDLLTREEVEKLLARVKSAQPGLYDDLIPATLSLSDFQKVLQQLLKEQVSIRNIEQIMESLADPAKKGRHVEELSEMVRQSLARIICGGLMGNNSELPVLTFDPLLEQKLQQGLRVGEETNALLIDPGLTESILNEAGRKIEGMMSDRLTPVLLCSPSLRRHVKRMVDRVYPYLHVISLAEIPRSISIKSYGVIAERSLTELQQIKNKEVLA